MTSINKRDVVDKVKQIIIDQLDDNMTILHDDTDLYGELNLDVVTMDSIVLEIEDEFKIKMPNSDIDAMIIVGDVINYVIAKVTPEAK